MFRVFERHEGRDIPCDYENWYEVEPPPHKTAIFATWGEAVDYARRWAMDCMVRPGDPTRQQITDIVFEPNVFVSVGEYKHVSIGIKVLNV